MRPSALVPLACLAAAALALQGAPAAAGAGGTPQSKAQQKCIASYGAAAANVARARTAENERCLAAFAKGKTDQLDAPTLRSCLARDAKGKIGKALAKVEKTLAKSCAGAGDPDFGVPAGGSAPAANVGAGEATKLFLDVLSENLFATARTCDDDSDGCKCQGAALDAVADLSSAALTEFGSCAKKVLKAGAATLEELENCLNDSSVEGSIAADSKGRIEKASTRVVRALDKRCADSSSAVLPGKCLGVADADRGACYQAAGVCRACLALNAIHGLQADCDGLDDDQSNRSCPGGAVAQESRTATSSARPAETPGTAGVVVTNPKLLAQFGGRRFNLNHARYTRIASRARRRRSPTRSWSSCPASRAARAASSSSPRT